MLAGIEDPAQYAARALRQALEERGITVTAAPRRAHRYPDEVEDLTQSPGPRHGARGGTGEAAFRRP